MKKSVLMLLTVLLGLLAAPVVMAQDGNSLVDRLASDSSGQFTTLVSALEAAGLAETLSADGDYTLFAPTNDAFDAALGTLGISLDELLGNTELLTQILTYHVVANDRVFFREFSRTPTLTTLEGSDLTLSLTDGVPMVNDVTFSGVDRASSNGVYHIIDGVLLPPDLSVALPAATPEVTAAVTEAAVTPEATAAATEAVATPEATEAAAVVAAATAEATPMTLDANTAMLRFAFLSPDSTPLVMTINGEPAGDGNALVYPTLTDWMAVPAGTMTVSGVPEGEGMEALLRPFELALAGGSWTTLAIVGSEQNGTYIAQPILEDYSPIAAGSARATVFHGIEGAPPIDLTSGGQVLVSRLAYPGTRGDNDGAYVIELPAGSSDLQVILSGTGSGTGDGTVVLVDLAGFDLAENTNTFIAIIGTPNEPDILSESTDMSQIAQPAQ